MFLKKKKTAAPDAPRTVLEQTAAIGVTPGQKILGLMTALIGSGLILGTVFYYRVLPGMKEEQKPKQAAQQGQDSTAVKAPTLSVPLELNGAQEQPHTTNSGVFPNAPPGLGQGTGPQPTVPPIAATGGTSKPYPPGLAGSPAQSDPNSAYPASGQAMDPDAEVVRQRKRQGQIGSFGPTATEQQQAQAQPAANSAAPASAARPATGMSPTAGAASLQSTGSGTTALSSMLVPTTTPGTAASYMGNQHMTLAKGTSITCTLDNAIQTDQFGFVQCLTDYPIYSMDGKVVLAERGTKLDGEYARGMEPGQKSIFVLWTRGRTPTGVIFNLASPGTDKLGRAGIHGDVDTKFWDRFGGALLFSVMQDASDVAISRATNTDESTGRNVVLLPNTQSTGQNAIGEILKQGGNIKPSLYKNQGDSVAITVARDIDFSTVYRLTAKAAQ